MSIPSDNPILLARDLGPGESESGAPAPGYSLAVGDGEIVALTGTSRDVAASLPLLRRLAGAEAASGALWLKGEPLHTLRPAARQRFSHATCVVLPQETNLLAELSVAENATMPLLLAGLGRQEARRRALQWLERLGVATCADWRVDELTAAELRRLALARALVVEPTVLLAQDPLADLTEPERQHLLRILRVAAGTHRLTLIIATADEDLARWADRRVALPTAAEEEPEPEPPARWTQGADVVHLLHGVRHRLAHGRHRATDGAEVGASR